MISSRFTPLTQSLRNMICSLTDASWVGRGVGVALGAGVGGAVAGATFLQLMGAVGVLEAPSRGKLVELTGGGPAFEGCFLATFF